MKRWVIPVLMLLAAALRFRQYFANRSLWLDEAKLSLNILHRSFAQLWQPLDYHQGAPVGFLGIEKWAVTTFGTSEYALRLFPLLAGTVSIFLFYLLARRVVRSTAVPLALALFAISPVLIYYASEVKQYSSDVAFALLLVYLAVTERILLLGICGAVAIWFSHPAVFVLGGIFGVLLLRHWRNWKVHVAGTLWVSSFAVCYFVLLRKLSQDATLLAYWQQNFMPFPPNPKWFEDSFFHLFSASAALRFTGLAAFVFLCGGVSLWKRNRETQLLLLSPVVPTLLASAVHKYPFGGRLALFLVPILLLLMAEGAETIRTVAGNRFGVILVVVLLIDPGLYTLHRFVSPFSGSERAGVMPLEEMRPLVVQLKSRLRAGDAVYVYHDAKPSLEYYAERTGFPSENVMMGTAGGDDPKSYEADLIGFAGRRVWVVLSHMEGTEEAEPGYLKFYMRLKGNRLANLTFPGAEADLYEVQP
jgi:4-amino-4-deoxy-L-arabinose transferase-like glycosyltransferase